MYINSIYMDIDYKKLIKPSIGLTCSILIYYGILQYFVINVIMFLYLLLKTINSINNEEFNGEFNDDSKDLLKIWTVYGCLVNIDYIFNAVSNVLPFGSIYQFVRVGMILWLSRPSNNINIVYDRLINTINMRYNNIFKKYLDTVDAYKNYLNNNLDGITEVSYTAITQLLSKHTEIIENHIKDDKTI